MQIETWKLINLNDFDKAGVPQQYFTQNLEGYGQANYMVLKAFELYGVLFAGELVFPGLNGINPYLKKRVAAYIDEDRNLQVGIVNENNG